LKEPPSPNDELLLMALLPVSAKPLSLFLALLLIIRRSLDEDLMADVPTFYPLPLEGAVVGG
jgi:hypothetical protein